MERLLEWANDLYVASLVILRHALPLADSSALRPGDDALAARQPLGDGALERLERSGLSLAKLPGLSAGGGEG